MPAESGHGGPHAALALKNACPGWPSRSNIIHARVLTRLRIRLAQKAKRPGGQVKPFQKRPPPGPMPPTWATSPGAGYEKIGPIFQPPPAFAGLPVAKDTVAKLFRIDSTLQIFGACPRPRRWPLICGPSGALAGLLFY